MVPTGLKQRRDSGVRLSVVIPAYNEEARLPETLRKTVSWCDAYDLEFEVLVVDDGSRDGTVALGRVFAESDQRIRVLA